MGLPDSLHQDDWQVNIVPGFVPEFHWAPHLTPTDNYIIAQHVFRAPALIVTSREKNLTIIPDLDLLNNDSPVDWYMDLDAPDNTLTLGLSKSEVKEHVLYVRTPGAVYPPGKISFGFYILYSEDEEDVRNPWRDALAFLWERWGHHELQEY